MKPYYQDSAVTIYHGDCREILPGLEPVNLVLTDPPYELADSRPGNSIFGASLKKFDSAAYRDIISGFDHKAVFAQLANLCNPFHSFCFCSNKQISKLMHYGELTGYYTTLLVWNKINSAPFANGVWRGDAEFCVHMRASGAYFEGNAEIKRKVVQLPIVANQVHPTEKPIELVKKYIEIGSSACCTILDPFMGSGTTLRAAKDLNRKAIGIEIEEKYCEIAATRMSQEVLAL